MGTRAEIFSRTGDEARAQRASAAAFARMAELEAIFSDYRPDSEAMRLCAKAGEGRVAVSDDLFRILTIAREISEASDGAFDVTVGPLTHPWREARREGRLLTGEERKQGLARVGWRNVVLHEADRTVELKIPGMILDLGGIGKGYAADAALETMRAHGLNHAWVACGGDIAYGDPPAGESWPLHIAGIAGSPDREVPVGACGVSTSGDAEQFLVVDGARYSHILDPRTGFPLRDQLQATVIAPRAVYSDALASTISVLGIERAETFAAQFGARTVIQSPGKMEGRRP